MAGEQDRSERARKSNADEDPVNQARMPNTLGVDILQDASLRQLHDEALREALNRSGYHDG